MYIEDEVQGSEIHSSFISTSEFMEELNRELRNSTANTGVSAVLRLRLDAHVPGVAFGGDVDGAEMLRLSLDRLGETFQASDLLCSPKPGILLALLRNVRCEDDVERLCDRIVRIGERTLSIRGKTFLSEFTVGASIAGQQQGDAASLMRQVAFGMRPSDPARDSFELSASEIESYVRDSLRKKQFGLSFQPQSTRAGEWTGVGVLTHMQIPGAEWLAEESCLAWVEDAELVLEISKQTLRSACLQAGDWHRRGVAISSFSVAIPTAHFLQKDFTQTLLALLKEAGIPGSLLELGLTGSTIRANLDATGSVLGALSPSGVRFCVRGSGVASLPAPYLRSLPIQTLEVSCSERATTLPNSVGVVRALVSHGCRLGLIVRATDVRSNAQRLAVLEAGCDVLQGPCVAKAFSAGELEAARLFSKGLPTKRSTRPVAFLKREFCS